MCSFYFLLNKGMKIKRWLREKDIWFSVVKNETKSYWRGFRSWLNLGKTTFAVEWSFWSAYKHLGFHLNIATHDDFLQVGFAPYFFSFYFTIENHKLQTWLSNKIKRKDETYGSGRSIGVSIHGGSIWVDLWNDPMEHRRGDPKWWHFNIPYVDILLGKSKCSTVELETHEISIPMPEKTYPAKAIMKEYTWKRARWFDKKILRCEITLKEGIPLEGKGENSWDCGINYTYGVTTGKVNDVFEAVGDLVASTLRNRIKYGGWDDYRWPDSKIEKLEINTTTHEPKK